MLPALTGVGGMMGGQTGTTGMFDASGLNFNVLMAGRAYASAGGNIYCYNITNGERLWVKPGSYNYGEYYGGETSQAVLGRTTTGRTGTPALLSFGSRFIVYDGLDGHVILNVTGMSVFSYHYPFAYTEQSYGSGLAVNNGTAHSNLIKWWTNGTTNTFANRIVWNVTNPAISVRGGGLYAANIAIGGGQDLMSEISYSIYGESFGLNASDGKTLWKANLTNPTWPTSGGSIGAYARENERSLVIFPIHVNQLCAIYIDTGQIAWTSEKTDYPWGAFWAYSHVAGYGLIIRGTYDGIYCFNATNGAIVWHFKQPDDKWFETPYGDWPMYGGPKLGDGKYYMSTYEHSPTLPILRGQRSFCFDAFTGEVIWSMAGTFGGSSLAYGTLMMTNQYTSESFAFARGNVEMTASASSKLTALGGQVLIEGSIMDMSPAQANTPAMSDASMSQWMEYLHVTHQPMNNFTGVPVNLDTLDPNGNIVHIGTATSDTTGKYSFLWTPQIEGKHTVMATFAGTKSYYPTQAESFAVGVGPAPTATGTSEQPTVSVPDLTWTIVGATIAIIIALAVVALLLLRRRP
jgi:outer membrane protein assembly factor BamB